MVSAAVRVPGIVNAWKAVEFLLDTGADETCVHPADAALRLGIPVPALADPQNTLWAGAKPIQAGGVGGSALYYALPATYAFLDDQGAVQTVDDVIQVAMLTATNRGLPSLMGRNILQRFIVTIDSRRQIVTLA